MTKEVILKEQSRLYMTFLLNSALNDVQRTILRNEMFPYKSQIKDSTEEGYSFLVENTSSQDENRRLSKIEYLLHESMSDLGIPKINNSEQFTQLETNIIDLLSSLNL